MIDRLSEDDCQALNARDLFQRNRFQIHSVPYYANTPRQTDIELMEKLIQDGIKAHQTGIPIDAQYEFYYAILENERANGFAYRFSKNKYLICMSYGTGLSLYRFFHAVLRAEPFTALTGLRRSTESTIDCTAKMFVGLVSTFIVYHEYAHILLGHLDLDRSGNGRQTNETSHAFMDEQVTRFEKKDAALTSQTLEWDADCFAACQTYANGGFLDLWTTQGEIAELIDTEEKRVALQALAVHLYFRYVNPSYEEDEALQSHPLPAKRSMMANATLFEFLKRHGRPPYAAMSYGEFASKYIMPILDADISVSAPDKPDEYFKSLMRHFQNQDWTLLHDRYEKLRDRLEICKLNGDIKLPDVEDGSG